MFLSSRRLPRPFSLAWIAFLFSLFTKYSLSTPFPTQWQTQLYHSPLCFARLWESLTKTSNKISDTPNCDVNSFNVRSYTFPFTAFMVLSKPARHSSFPLCLPSQMSKVPFLVTPFFSPFLWVRGCFLQVPINIRYEYFCSKEKKWFRVGERNIYKKKKNENVFVFFKIKYQIISWMIN